MAPTASASFWPLVFQFLEPEDLVTKSGDYFFDIVDTVADEELFEEFF